MSSSRPNPFHVLGLPVTADDRAVVERCKELTQASGRREDQVLAEWAKDELTGRSEVRFRHELLEPPGAAYRGDDWEDFARRHGRSPLPRGALQRDAEPPTPADFDLVAMLRRSLAALPEPADDLDVRPALVHSPVPLHLADKAPLEVRDVIFG